MTLCCPHAIERGAPVVAYHDAVRLVWRLLNLGPDANPDDCARARDDVVRLADDVGEPWATELRRRWRRAWWVETGQCPTCGEPGALHEPETT